MKKFNLREISSLLLKDGQVFDLEKESSKKATIFVKEGKIIKPEKRRPAEVLSLAGKYILPGFIDLHCHLREPGREDEETIETGTLSALKGGFVKIACMPNTDPPLDNQGLVKLVLEKGKNAGNAQVLPIGCATKERKGEVMAPLGELVDAGVVAVSDDGDPIRNPKMMRNLLEWTKVFDIPVIDHCEDKDLTADAVMNESAVSFKLGLKGAPDIAESLFVYRDLILAERTGGKLHLAHITTERSCEILAWAKDKGIEFSAETCPHYFTLTDEMVETFDPNYKVNPPLRTKRDVEAVKEALSKGLIDCITTDHAPHLGQEKESDFASAPAGIIGFETAFSLSYEELVLKGYLSLPQLVKKFTINPAKVLGIKCHSLAFGEEANLVIFNPKREWVYTEEEILSQSKNSPFIGRRLKGKIEAVIIGKKLFEF